MINLCDWYDRQIAVCLNGDTRVFETLITWVHDPPPQCVWHNGVEYVSHVERNMQNISLVFIGSPLPEYFHASAPRCLYLHTLTGEWSVHSLGGGQTPVVVRAL